MHVGLTPCGEVVNKLPNDACQSCCLNGGMDGTLKGRWTVPETEGKTFPHVEGLRSANTRELDAVGIHGYLPKTTSQVQLVEFVEGRDFGEYIPSVGDGVAIPASL